METDIINFTNAIGQYIDRLKDYYQITQSASIIVESILKDKNHYTITLKIFTHPSFSNIIDRYFIEFNANLRSLYHSSNFKFIKSFTHAYKDVIEIIYIVEEIL